MPDAVTDTHALIWYLQDDTRLSATAAKFFDDCQNDGGYIRVPSICLIEIVYLAEKQRISTETLQSFLQQLDAPRSILQLSSLDLPVVLAMASTTPTMIRDMPDRIIAATALRLGLPLISRDRAIAASGLATVW